MNDPCPACASPDTGNPVFVFDSSRKYNESWARCLECRSFYLHENFNADEEVATNYSICNRLEDGLMMNEYKSKLFDSVVNNANQYGTGKNGWLDIGCSYGGLLMKAQDNGYTNNHGTDIIKEALTYCESKNIITHQCFSLNEIDKALPCFDVISAIDSNMFWTNQPEEFRIIHAHLNPGGIFIAKVVDRSWLIRLVRFLGLSNTKPGKKAITKSIFNHRFSMPLKSFQNVLAGNGFEIVKISIAGALPTWKASFKLRLWYQLSHLIFKLTTVNLSPSALVVARKK